ncbi:hypothetical protein KPL78_29795 [Roseomonas sp. HJA6]|uniref:Mu-like prophage FluMu N-terminal domain-containing protein n=1 Tax=Roseomonas alba TaxID=2846776 RepID=A0ABS7AK11_9PROT|nr:hypothetical protein [Neoroseomonas alba]MBW6402077.1 hypothetical protein [Neoroseomonas alba]
MARLTPALIILCSTPGFRRGGIAHPARAEHPAGAFTFGELEAMAAEPRLQLIPLEAVSEGVGADAHAAFGGPVPLAGDNSPSVDVGGDRDPATGAGPDDMPGRPGAEAGTSAVDAPDGTVAAPAVAPAPEPIQQAEEGAVSSEGQAATPGDGAADGEQEAAEAAGVSTPARKRGRGKA